MDEASLELDMDNADATLLPTAAPASEDPEASLEPSAAPSAAPLTQKASAAMTSEIPTAVNSAVKCTPTPAPLPTQSPAPPGDEFLRLSRQCRANVCFRLQWEVEMNPRCLRPTTIVRDDGIYLFDGFCVLCHGDPPSVPQFEYTRGGVMCKVNFIREELPPALRGRSNDLQPDEQAHDEFCQSVYFLQRFLFQQVMGIQPAHMFSKIFADPSRATGDPSEICGDYHLIPRFISVKEEPLLNRQDLTAPNRIGFAVGRLLSVKQVVEYLDASARFTIRDFITQLNHQELVDCVVTTRTNGVPSVFRVDEVVTETKTPGDAEGSVPKGIVSKDGNHVVVALRHRDEGSGNYDGAKHDKKVREWRKFGDFLQLSPQVDPLSLELNLAEAHITGLRTDMFEIGSAMPMILKHIRHCNLLSSFADSMSVKFKDKALLRQAFTHASFVDVGMPSVNTVEATTARVRLAHVFENTASLKRSRSMAFRDETLGGDKATSKISRDIKQVADKHLSGDFKQEFHSRFLCPYERLEFLGDAVLSFLVASSAFLKLPEAHEGDLHQTRVDLTNNDTLGKIARTANFESLLLSAFDLDTLQEEVKLKIIADCFEAVLGALYKDQGIEQCRALLGRLMGMHDPELRDLCFLSTEQVIEEAHKYVEIDRTAMQSSKKYSMTRLTHKRFEKRTGVPIQNTHLWLQALTHPSFKAPQIEADEFLTHDPDYERIEFLGDAVLQVLSSEFLVEAFPYHQEHLLTQVRSSLVKNTRLAVVARKTGYEEFVRLGNLVKQSGALYVEDVLADVFEATLGAVFLENPSNLDCVRAILKKTVFPQLEEAIRRRQWMNPQKVLTHYMSQWSKTRTQPIRCTFALIPAPSAAAKSILVPKDSAATGKTKQQPQPMHAVVLCVNGSPVARAVGRTIHAAKDAACKSALRKFGVRLHDD